MTDQPLIPEPEPFDYDAYEWPGAALITARLADLPDEVEAIVEEWCADEDDAGMIVAELSDWIVHGLLPRMAVLLSQSALAEDPSISHELDDGEVLVCDACVWGSVIDEVRKSLSSFPDGC